MNLVKSNWFRMPVFLLLLIFFWAFFGSSNNSNQKAQINKVIESVDPTPTPSPFDNNSFDDLLSTLPKFEDYPAKVHPIPPKPKIDHKSNPYGMRFWTVLENDASNSYGDDNGIPHDTLPRTQYDMGGHYLMNRHGTGNPDVLIVDGLTGQVFNEYGGINYEMKVDSNLVIFEPFREDCFSQTGDYECYYDGISGGGNSRYALWNGEQFVTVCEPEVKNWNVVSCGEAADKNSTLYGKRKVSWMGTVATKMTYGRLRIKTLDGADDGNVFSTSGISFRAEDNLVTAQYGYSEFIAEPKDVDDTVYRKSKTTENIKIGDLVQVTGYWEFTDNGFPWILIERLDKYR